MILLAVVLLGWAMTAGAQTTTVSDKTNLNGTTYVSSSSRSTTGSSDIKTDYQWSNGKDDIVYDIYLHKITKGDNEGQWTCYVWRTSKKTGNEYKYYLPDGIAIANDIIKRNPGLIH